MDENDFEGSLVLERLAEKGLVEDFFDAIDSDDFGRAKILMEIAEIHSDTITIVLKKMNDADGKH